MPVLVLWIEMILRRKGFCGKHILEHMKRLETVYHDRVTGFMHSWVKTELPWIYTMVVQCRIDLMTALRPSTNLCTIRKALH